MFHCINDRETDGWQPQVLLSMATWCPTQISARRLRIFRKSSDFEAFEAILAGGIERIIMRICGYCIMSNHWHLLLWPYEDGDLSDYMR